MSSKRRRVDVEQSSAAGFGMFAQYASAPTLHARSSAEGSTVNAELGSSSAPAAAPCNSCSTPIGEAGLCANLVGRKAPVGTLDRKKVLQPVIASDGGIWRERYSSVCQGCYGAAVPCPHYQERPLTLLIIGHNPSEHTWSTGFPYSNPSNRFWSLLVESEILPKTVPPEIQPPDRWTPAAANRLPDILGIGITDVGCEPGSEADKYPRATMVRWRADLYARLRAHRDRAGRAPAVVAFSGVRQYSQLFNPPLKRLKQFGKQNLDGKGSGLPPGWPYRACDTEIFVLPSSSGRAAFTKQERLAPYQQLGHFLQQLQSRQQLQQLEDKHSLEEK